MAKVRFSPEEFAATRWDMPAEKARFANQFVTFVAADFPASRFYNWFYERLSHTFGHIAHSNRQGFYDEWFSSTARKVRFLDLTVNAPSSLGGDPAHTWSDVERALADWVRASGWLDHYRKRLDSEIETAERAALARLSEKYGPVAGGGSAPVSQDQMSQTKDGQAA